ncbi:hypothetical protein HK096_011362 [Nowakowskiella sp. JEL0078]|nr:hypothetical protein HK096_011362 [Nowakowskiella sp. JEL0078]
MTKQEAHFVIIHIPNSSNASSSENSPISSISDESPNITTRLLDDFHLNEQKTLVNFGELNIYNGPTLDRKKDINKIFGSGGEPNTTGIGGKYKQNFSESGGVSEQSTLRSCGTKKNISQSGGEFNPNILESGGEFKPNILESGGEFKPSILESGGEFKPNILESGGEFKPSILERGGESKLNILESGGEFKPNIFERGGENILKISSRITMPDENSPNIFGSEGEYSAEHIQNHITIDLEN